MLRLTEVVKFNENAFKIINLTEHHGDLVVLPVGLPVRDDVLEDDVLVHDDPGVLSLRLARLGQVRRDGAAPLLGLSARQILGARVAQARNLVGPTIQGFHDGLKMDK